MEINDLVSVIGLPTGAVALAVGLVRGAKALETDANPRALKYVSDLLTEGDLKNIGKAGATLVPFVFDKVFGPKPFSFRFISRSIIATTLFWLILMLASLNWQGSSETGVFSSRILDLWSYTVTFMLCWYFVDWLSLLKAKKLISLISQNYSILSSLSFAALDLICSYALSFAFIEGGVIVIRLTEYLIDQDMSHVRMMVDTIASVGTAFYRLLPIRNYLHPSPGSYIVIVMIPTTLLTSIWSVLLFISCIVAQLLVPIDYLRRFTTFWFKDVGHHPLTAIAKVAATLIVVGAMAIKAVRWIY